MCTLILVFTQLVLCRHFFADKIEQQKLKLIKFKDDLQKHKDDVQDALEFYYKLTVETQAEYVQITSLLANEQRSEAANAMLTKLQEVYSAFVSADYMMSKNLPFWGESPQPAKTSDEACVCDVFGMMYSQQGSYTCLCD